MKATLLTSLLLVACTHAPKPPATILFLCPYGGAKSVVAASYFNEIARAQGLDFIAVAAAAEEPYDAVPEKVATYLQQDGIDVHQFKPHHVTEEEIESAAKIITIDCDLTKLDTNGRVVEQWNDVPKMSADLPGSASSIRNHVEALITSIKLKRNARSRSE